jgi:hypothetical protein
MNAILPIICMLFTVAATLTALVGCMLMGANSTPAQILTLKLWMAGLSLLGLAGVVASIVLLRSGQHNWATGAALLPTIAIAIIFLVAMIK